MKNIVRYSLQLYFLLLMVAFLSCKKSDGYNTPISKDDTKPGVVTNVKIEDFNGGSVITYKLPNTENLLYVLAKYKINDKVFRETKSSFYTDTIVVNGFAKKQEYEVTLYAVSRANVLSDAVTVKVHPDTPIYQLVRKSIKVAPDFGGINIQGLNPLKKPVGVIIVGLDQSTNSLAIVDQYYTKADTINYSLRGYNTDPRNFGVYLTDEYGNISDTLTTRISPLFEELLDKSKFSTYRLPSDADLYADWTVDRLWDNKLTDPGWHTVASTIKKMPAVVTFSIGKTAQLSRFVLFNRPGEYAYSHGNAKVFSLWGSLKDSPADYKLPLNAPVGTVLGDWVNLANYRFPNPPSGNSPFSATDADRKYVADGVNFNVPFLSPKVKYLRLCISESWSGGGFAHAMEISLYGKAD